MRGLYTSGNVSIANLVMRGALEELMQMAEELCAEIAAFKATGFHLLYGIGHSLDQQNAHLRRLRNLRARQAAIRAAIDEGVQHRGEAGE